MQMETWNILLNVVIAVLLVGYGVWLRNIFSQQLASKDSTIENLGAAIKANEAEIARLRGETAPAIAESYQRLKQFAEGMASESNNLAAQLEIAESKRATISSSASALTLIGRMQGFVEASTMVRGRIMEFINGPNPSDASADQLLNVMTQILTSLSDFIAGFLPSGDQAKVQ